MTDFPPTKTTQPPMTEHRPDDAMPQDAEQLHELCETWSHWSRTRRFYGQPPVTANVLGKLTTRTRAWSRGAPDALCSADMAALHLAIQAQPREALDRRVFELYYLYRVRNIKAAAAELGVSRQHFYTLLRAFQRRVYLSSKALREAHAQSA